MDEFSLRRQSLNFLTYNNARFFFAKDVLRYTGCPKKLLRNNRYDFAL